MSYWSDFGSWRKYGFVDSVSGDRPYNIQDFNRINKILADYGVMATIGEHFRIQALPDGTGVRIGTGKLFTNSRYFELTAPKILKFRRPKQLQHILIYARLFNSEDRRELTIFCKYSKDDYYQPELPKISSADKEYGLPLGIVTIRNASLSPNGIEQADITSYIGTSKCPYIYGITKTIDTDSLKEKWDAKFKSLSSSQTITCNTDVASVNKQSATNLGVGGIEDYNYHRYKIWDGSRNYNMFTISITNSELLERFKTSKEPLLMDYADGVYKYEYLGEDNNCRCWGCLYDMLDIKRERRSFYVYQFNKTTNKLCKMEYSFGGYDIIT